MKTDKFTILRDNKEKVGYWDFSFSHLVEDIEVCHLKTGDYSIKGLTEIISIERKKTTNEISINLGLKWKTFQAEFERLSIIKYRYVICEFSIDNLLEYPVNSGMPKYLWKHARMSGKFMLSRIGQLSDTYGVEFIFAGNKHNAEKKAIELLEHAYING